MGAGAIIAHLGGDLTPEARAAADAFQAAAPNLRPLLEACASGQELIARGFAGDVSAAADLDVSDQIPLLMKHRRRYGDLTPNAAQPARRAIYYAAA